MTEQSHRIRHGDTLTVCAKCSALVLDAHHHARWHTTQQATAITIQPSPACPQETP